MPMIRTGMESAICFRLSEPFIINAKEDCIVTAVSPVMITVKYASGKMHSYKLGYLGGKSGGLTVAHKMVTNHKAGTKLKTNMAIAYNESFFAPDWANPGYCVIKVAKTIKVSLPESEHTIEDSMAMSDAISEKMATEIITQRAIVVNFDQAITNTAKIADYLTYDSVVCYVTEQSAIGDGPLDSEALEQLKRLGAHAPRAKADGVLHSIVVYYNGELSEMSPSLRKMVKASDDRLADEARSASEPIHTGAVSSEYRVKAEPLQNNQAVIMYNIIEKRDAGSADKYVLANQLKCTVSESYPAGSIKTEDGEDVDAIFGSLGISNRIVTSVYSNGSTSTLVRLMTEAAIKAYDNK